MCIRDRFSDDSFARNYVKRTLEKIWGRKDGQITDISFPLELRPLKINTVLSFDGFLACVTGKSTGGTRLGLSSMMPLILSLEWEEYVKRLESFSTKKEKNTNLILNEEYDGISREKNWKLYDILASKVSNGIYKMPFSAQIPVLENGYNKFVGLSMEEQIQVLQNLILLLKSGRAGGCDLKKIGGSVNSGVYVISAKMSNWKEKFIDVRIIDVSSSGLYKSESSNLLELFE